MKTEVKRLRQLITENIRVQRGKGDDVTYIDANNALTDVSARQNHVVFGRRGCGKSLLLQFSGKTLPDDIRTVYLNCEDFKQHSFPNVLIEILDAIFRELEEKRFAWFGRKKRLNILLTEIRNELNKLKAQDDEREERVKETSGSSVTLSSTSTLGATFATEKVGATGSLGSSDKASAVIGAERQYESYQSKLVQLNKILPELKRRLREIISLSSKARSVFVHIDDFYHLKPADQPFIMDYIHRLCKDVPVFFKIATLRHATVLYAEPGGQPTGAQEHHDYQPIEVDFSFDNFQRTEEQVKRIFNEFGRLAGVESMVNVFFKGEGFRRLVLAGGGVPRDCLSLFLQAHEMAQASDGRIGKDDIRKLTLGNLERRIEELKQDAHRDDQDALLRGIAVIREFCLEKGTNIFLISEKELREDDDMRRLVHRLLDYRIVHAVGAAITHKTHQGTFRAYAIDVGCYAQFRKLDSRFSEVDLSAGDAKERLRSAPTVTKAILGELWRGLPSDVGATLTVAASSDNVEA